MFGEVRVVRVRNCLQLQGFSKRQDALVLRLVFGGGLVLFWVSGFFSVLIVSGKMFVYGFRFLLDPVLFISLVY